MLKSNIEIPNNCQSSIKNVFSAGKRKFITTVNNFKFGLDTSNIVSYCVLLDIEDNDVPQKQNWIVQKW